MGPQYVSRLGDLLDDVSRGHQVVATDPTLLSEDLSRPVRGHDMRAWDSKPSDVVGCICLFNSNLRVTCSVNN